MPAGTELFVDRSSWLHRADPRVKLLFVLLAIACLLLMQNLFALLFTAALLLALHVGAGTPVARLTRVARALLPLSVVIFLLRVAFQPVGEPLAVFGPLSLTPLAAAEGVALVARLYAMAFAVFAWLYTTDQDHLVLGLVRLGVPHAWGLVLALALRFIPTFQTVFEQISHAQQARGLDLSRAAGLGRLRRMMPVFIAMVISNLRASEQLARALEARGFGAPGVARTYRLELRMRGLDYLYAGGLVVLATMLIYVVVAHGFATHPLRLLDG